MEVGLLELKDREEANLAGFVTIRVGQVWWKADVDVPPPRCHAHNSGDAVCWGFYVCVCVPQACPSETL